MAFKFVILCTVLAVASAGYSPVVYSAPVPHYAVANPSQDAVGSTQHNVVRSYAGTVSQYSKAVDTPYSSVRKSDTRINNNVYTPTYAKTLAYAAPAQVVKYAAPQAVYAHQAAPQAVYAHQAAPQAVYAHQSAPATVYTHSAPAVYTHQAAAPATVYSHAAPAGVIAHHQAPSAYVSHVDPTIASYSSKTISYSPAAAVAHVTFDGFGAHYGY
ncbi:larval/pupal cuticle protein H1C-like [Eupeodes corollae]|uniref:larval/pupal cuticle protein H1C-like n=1 Tax=Eupeodes corollae TaxID=290404 RepID=UPI0024932700|nr:larval/pupal cuticle protein H1C-like [Eupeodes corollae]